jgi:hypothetical protein
MEMQTRRKFLQLTALAASGTITGVEAAVQKKRNAGDLLKIGVILGENSHSTGWAAMINGIDGEKTYPKRTGMVYTHVWHVDNTQAELFAKKFGLISVVKNYDDMTGKVDGLIIDTFMQTPWVYKLAAPYLENGIPVFIDRPGSDAIWKVKKLIALAKKNNTPFWTGSSLERMYQCIQAQEHHPPETITGYETWSEGQPTFYCHGLHGMWWTHKITGGGIRAVSQKMADWKKGGGISTVFHKDHSKGDYTGIIHHENREKSLIWTKFTGNDQIYRYDAGHWENFVYLPLLLTIQDIFYSGMAKLPESYDSLLEKSKLFLSAFRSHLRENGEPVELDKLDEDWAVGCPWGHPGMSVQYYTAYKKLLGVEKGELRPPA